MFWYEHTASQLGAGLPKSHQYQLPDSFTDVANTSTGQLNISYKTVWVWIIQGLHGWLVTKTVHCIHYVKNQIL